MLFSSYIFVYGFLPLSVLGFYLLPYPWRNGLAGRSWIIASSFLFYGWYNPIYLTLLIASIIGNYLVGLRLGPYLPGRRVWLVLGLAGNIGSLAYFKYWNFLVDNINTAFGPTLVEKQILLPLAISFVTFQQVTYLVACFREGGRQFSPIDYALVVSFFPHLIAGPIIRPSEIMPQLQRPEFARGDRDAIATGMALFILGLFKKTVLADSLAPIADHAFNGQEIAKLQIIPAWEGLLAYSLQIYLDFSAYSNMAIGLGLIFGLLLPTNFDRPYLASSIIEFWRRWHITLSMFLRDYIYIPLGGNRRSTSRRYGNLFLTMAIGGLWHGAGWTFVAWGMLHGVYLVIDHEWRRHNLWMPRILSWPVTIVAIMLAWVFFRAQNMHDAWAYFAKLFTITNGYGSFGSTYLSLVACGWVILEGSILRFRPNWPYAIGLGVCAFLALLFLGTDYEFIYFRF